VALCPDTLKICLAHEQQIRNGYALADIANIANIHLPRYGVIPGLLTCYRANACYIVFDLPMLDARLH
jgi:hypothetical protein